MTSGLDVSFIKSVAICPVTLGSDMRTNASILILCHLLKPHSNCTSPIEMTVNALDSRFSRSYVRIPIPSVPKGTPSFVLLPFHY